jgi:hypothetical protein
MPSSRVFAAAISPSGKRDRPVAVIRFRRIGPAKAMRIPGREATWLRPFAVLEVRMAPASIDRSDAKAKGLRKEMALNELRKAMSIASASRGCRDREPLEQRA